MVKICRLFDIELLYVLHMIFSSIVTCLAKNGVVPFDIEPIGGCGDGFKLFISCWVFPFDIEPDGRDADDFILFV